jgi:hypothetical protein
MRRIVTGNYTSYKALVDAIHAQINKDLTIPLQKVAEEVKEYLRKYVDEHWYGAHSHEYYDRTMQFINSLTVDTVQSTGDRKEVAIYFDPSKISANKGAPGMWNQHMDVYELESAALAIAGWIEEGNGPSPLYEYDGIHQIEQTELFWREGNRLAKAIAELLAAKGYIVKVK